jgi:hypothetical protein
MLLHLNFCIEWFDSNSKEDLKSFENALKYLKRKKKRNSFLFSVFSPACPQPTIAAACLLPRAWPVSARGRLPRFPAWAKPAAGRLPCAPVFSRFPALSG